MKRIHAALLLTSYLIINGLSYADECDFQDRQAQESERLLHGRAMDEEEMIIIEGQDPDMPGDEI